MIWPAIDLLDGQCVQLIGGDPATARFQQDATKAAKHWVELGADGLHIVDLNAALGTGDNSTMVEQIARDATVPVQFGGGIRDLSAIERAFDLGANRLIVGTRGVQDPNWLAEMAGLFPNRIVLAVDARNNEITVSGWTAGSGKNLFEFVEEMSALPLAGLLYTNVEIEGSLSGIDPAPILKLCTLTPLPVLVSGGIKDADDIMGALQLGASGVVLGTALYSGNIELKALQEKLGKNLSIQTTHQRTNAMDPQHWIQVSRKTNETNIELSLSLELAGEINIQIDDFFLKHMLESFAVHGQLGLSVNASGDNHHHLVEDVGIVLGQAIRKSVTNLSIVRIAHSVVPMDEALVMVALDLVDRPFAQVSLPDPMYAHFMRSMALDGKFTLHVRPLAGDDVHHTVEAAFKALGRALRQAAQPGNQIASTKGDVQ